MSLFGKDPRDVLIEALQAEVLRAQDRENAYQARETAHLALIGDLTNKLSAHMDIRAHVAATPRPAASLAPQQPTKPVARRLPAGAATLLRRGQYTRKRPDAPAVAGLGPQVE